MWIRPLQAELSDNTLALYAPNRFVLDWVRDKYLNINGLLNDFCGADAPQLRLRWALSPPARCRKGDSKPSCGAIPAAQVQTARGGRRSCALAGIMSRRPAGRPTALTLT